MRTLLFRLGGAAAEHPWRVISTWLGILAAIFTLSLLVGGSPRDDYNVPGSPAQAGTDFLTGHFAERSGTDARVVIHSNDGQVAADDLASVSDRLRELNGVGVVDPPRMSADGDTALISISYDIPVTDFTGSEGIDALEAATAPLRDAGLQVELGGQVAENFSAPSGTAEAVGIIAALIILVIAFGSVVAAGLPLAVAMVGLGIGSSLIAIMAAFTSVSTTAPTIASMVGIGVGIDYALLLVSRHVEGLKEGLSIPEAAARANGSAGVSVIFAGTTVLASLLGLRLAGLPIYSSFGFATLAVVSSVMVTAVTLVPALCGLAGYRLLRRKDREVLILRQQLASGTAVHGRKYIGRHRPMLARFAPTLTAKWAARIGRRPLPWAIGALAILLLLAAPVLNMRTWPQDAGSQPESNTTRQAYDLVAAEFGPGANGPFVLAVDTSQYPVCALPDLFAQVSAEPGVAAVAPPVVNAAGDAALIVVQPTTAPDDEATTELLQRLRTQVLPSGVMVTGLVPIYADISERLADRLWVVVAFVVALSLILLTSIFRSVVVAVKAAVMNLLSVAAAYGVMVAVFQWGWGSSLLGLPHAVPVSSWVPILMFTILFGLSMDYHVFLLSRISEDWLATGEAHGSVVRGLALTGRIITSAAAIMVAVFIGFALDADITVKMMGFGMAVAVFVDATLVRMVLVPASMSLLGKANWWLPGWLDRLLPNLEIDKEYPAPTAAETEESAPEGAPEPVPLVPEMQNSELRTDELETAAPVRQERREGSTEFARHRREESHEFAIASYV